MTLQFRPQAGVPFSLIFPVPYDPAWYPWRLLADFEVRSQVRATPPETGTLVYDLTSHLSKAITGPDATTGFYTVTVTLALTGAETRLLAAGFVTAGVTGYGYFDVIISDTGTTDGHALRIPDNTGGVMKMAVGRTTTAAS